MMKMITMRMIILIIKIVMMDTCGRRCNSQNEDDEDQNEDDEDNDHKGDYDCDDHPDHKNCDGDHLHEISVPLTALWARTTIDEAEEESVLKEFRILKEFNV